MPTYDYRCRMCDWKRTRRAPLYADAITCESCGETAFRNPINQFNVNENRYTGELLPGHDDMRDQLVGYSTEADRAYAENKANGWEGLMS